MSSSRDATIVSAALAAALLLCCSETRADELADARQLFDAGAAAYEVGDYGAAIQAFEQARALAPRPGLSFSLGQAHRRRYFTAAVPDRADLSKAIEHYRGYLAADPRGNRRADAREALAELVPLAERLAAESEVEEPTAPAPEPAATRVLIKSPAHGARISLDGAEPVPAPLIRAVTPGPHEVRVTATGHYAVTQQLDAVDGQLVPYDVPLRAVPARLAVKLPDGGDVAVDGKPLAAYAGEASIELPAGRHSLAVTRAGHHPFLSELVLANGETRSLDAGMALTTQRVTAYALAGVTGATVVLSASLGAAALVRQEEALDIRDRSATENLSEDDVASYAESVAARDDFQTATAGTAIAAGGLAVITLLVYLLDEPIVAPADAPRDPYADSPTPGVEVDGTLDGRAGTLRLRF